MTRLIPLLPSGQWTVIARGYYLLNCHCPRILSAVLSLPEGIIHPVVSDWTAGLSQPEGIICWTVIARGYYLLDCHCPRVLSAGLSLPEGIIHPVVSASVLTWFTRYIFYLNLQFPKSYNHY